MRTYRLVMIMKLIIFLSLTLLFWGCGGGGGGGNDGDAGGGSEVIVRYVDQKATGKNDGTSWVNAYTDLQSALTPAPNGQNVEIWVVNGTYKPTSGSDRSVYFIMQEGVDIYGGFTGNEVSRGNRDWEANVTILSGDIGIQSETSDNSYQVIAGANNATLDGFTITGANTINFYNGYCGGMGNWQCSPTVTNCTFSGNTSAFYGGGMYNHYSSPIVTNCSFLNNTSGDAGGGIFNGTNSNPIVSDCSFSGNTAIRGGGVYNSACSAIISNCTFSGNSGDEGGGMYNDDFNDANKIIVVTNCTFSGNSTTYYGEGGGMYNGNGSGLVVDNCTFANNTALDGAGMANGEYNSPIIINCTFSGNTARRSGGGMDNEPASPIVINCLFSDNSAPISGGGMYNSLETSPVITNCTFAGNISQDGGGIFNYALTTTTVTNSIVWGNTSTSGGSQIFIATITGTNVSISYSCVQDGTTDNNNITDDPMLSSSLQLQPVSPCINKGNNVTVPDEVIVDLAGNPRIIGGTVDIGAYEYQQ